MYNGWHYVVEVQALEVMTSLMRKWRERTAIFGSHAWSVAAAVRFSLLQQKSFIQDALEEIFL